MIELIKRGSKVSIIAEKPYEYSNFVKSFKITEHKTMKVLFEAKKLFEVLKMFKKIDEA